MASDDSKILGVVLIVRHGDRLGFYQNPTTYSATATQITPLGNQQEFQLGELLQSIYLNSSSPSYISAISTGLFNQSQVYIRADLGGESGVVYDSCVSLTQGLWPITADNKITIANGSTIIAPLGGYQYVPIDAVDPNLDVSLEGFLYCNTFDTHTTNFYNSATFQQMADQSAAFLELLPPYLDGRSVSLENMWNIFDYMNVNNIHNATFAENLPPTFLAQARALANWHEYNVFTDTSVSGIGNIAGQTIVPSILNAFEDIVNTTNPIKMVITAIAYKPFLSLFNMTGVAAANPHLAGIVDYASVVAYEVRQPSAGGEPVIRFNFKNGSDDGFASYDFLNQSGDVPLSVFINTVAPSAVNTTAAWCNICENSQDRGCGALSLAAEQARSAALSPVSVVSAGFLGAGLMLSVVILAFATMMFLGLANFGKKAKKWRTPADDEVELRRSPSNKSSLRADHTSGI